MNVEKNSVGISSLYRKPVAIGKTYVVSNQNIFDQSPFERSTSQGVH